MAIKRLYITNRARVYLITTKTHISTLIRDKGFSVQELSHKTQIPLSSLIKWLNQNNELHIPLPAVVVIAQALNVSVRDMLPPDNIPQAESDRYRAIEVFLQAPEAHTVMMANVYKQMVSSIR
ncbi:helix-turn-helix domain-containing protein [Aeromonas veronii]|uniref:helix-turn-helix domain-containing protein n=1 Tax=Aeromonas veronii TaxID=654 RepID=UPI0018F11997|nr:helix-turn-helix domain-containing protein [Aeromonas veronii]MBJ7592003.1 helix-turn-helix domain-containing protein [Aeromonas veronii]